MLWLVGADALEQPDSLPLAQLRPNFVSIMAANLAAQKVRGCSQDEPEPKAAEPSLPNNRQNLLVGLFNLYTNLALFQRRDK